MRKGQKFPKGNIARTLMLLMLVTVGLLLLGCAKNDLSGKIRGLVLTSPAVGTDSALPMRFTCDGISASPPVAWTGAPEATRSYALVMHHVASPTDVHCYWIVYDIPSVVHSIAENASGDWKLGRNSLNDRNEYAPPCSQGPGLKYYELTIYALSSELSMDTAILMVTRPVVTEAMRGLILDSSVMTVHYSRTP